ncbi:MAG: hypothetical protein WAO58_08965, partial [Fimbriimonadaceae bacterium]
GRDGGGRGGFGGRDRDGGGDRGGYGGRDRGGYGDRDRPAPVNQGNGEGQGREESRPDRAAVEAPDVPSEFPKKARGDEDVNARFRPRR